MPPGNDEFADATDCGFDTGTLSGTCTDATYVSTGSFTGEPLFEEFGSTHTVWYTYTPAAIGGRSIGIDCSFDSVVAVYTGDGTDVMALTHVASNDDTSVANPAGGFWHSYLEFGATDGVTYFIAVAGWRGNQGDFTMTISEVAPPAVLDNDDFADANPFDGDTGSVNGTCVDATNESGEPLLVTWASQHTVWYTYTPSADLTVGIGLHTDYDSVIGLYSGTAVDSLFEVGSNDDADDFATWDSYFEANVTAGTTYYIAVGGYSNRQGTFTLVIDSVAPKFPPANDNFGDAKVITGESGTDMTTVITDATRQTFEPSSYNRTAWYAWTPTADMDVFFSTGGSHPADAVPDDSFNTMLSVFVALGTIVAVPYLTQVVTNDNNPYATTLTSWLHFNATAGTTYYIQVSSDMGGTIVLTWGPTPLYATFQNPLMVQSSSDTSLRLQLTDTVIPGRFMFVAAFARKGSGVPYAADRQRPPNSPLTLPNPQPTPTSISDTKGNAWTRLVGSEGALAVYACRVFYLMDTNDYITVNWDHPCDVQIATGFSIGGLGDLAEWQILNPVGPTPDRVVGSDTGGRPPAPVWTVRPVVNNSATNPTGYSPFNTVMEGFTPGRVAYGLTETPNPPNVYPLRYGWAWNTATNTYTGYAPVSTADGTGTFLTGANSSGSAAGYMFASGIIGKPVTWSGGGSPSVVEIGPGDMGLPGTWVFQQASYWWLTEGGIPLGHAVFNSPTGVATRFSMGWDHVEQDRGSAVPAQGFQFHGENPVTGEVCLSDYNPFPFLDGWILTPGGGDFQVPVPSGWNHAEVWGMHGSVWVGKVTAPASDPTNQNRSCFCRWDSGVPTVVPISGVTNLVQTFTSVTADGIIGGYYGGGSGGSPTQFLIMPGDALTTDPYTGIHKLPDSQMRKAVTFGDTGTYVNNSGLGPWVRGTNGSLRTGMVVQGFGDTGTGVTGAVLNQPPASGVSCHTTDPSHLFSPSPWAGQTSRVQFGVNVGLDGDWSGNCYSEAVAYAPADPADFTGTFSPVMAASSLTHGIRITMQIVVAAHRGDMGANPDPTTDWIGSYSPPTRDVTPNPALVTDDGRATPWWFVGYSLPLQPAAGEEPPPVEQPEPDMFIVHSSVHR